MQLSNRAYDILKVIAMIWLPAIGSLYFGLADIWHLPYAQEIVGTITVVDTFLGAVLGISTANYNRSLIVGDEPADHIKEVG